MELQSSKASPQGTKAWLKQSNIVQAWLVLILALCFGTSLAGIQLTLGPAIEANKLNETLEKVPELVLGKDRGRKMAELDQKLDIQVRSVGIDKKGRKTFYNVYEAKLPNGKLAGWVAKAKGQGYADKIELLVGLNPTAKNITGIFVLDQKETPGLGNKIITDQWRGQFIGKKTRQPLVVVKGGSAPGSSGIDAITGATISSRSVTDIINATIRDLEGRLTTK